MLSGIIIALVVLVVLVLIVVPATIRVVQEYERGVIFRLGRLVGARGPGLFFLVPMLESMVKVDLRVLTLDVPSQEAITRDNVTLRVNAVVYFRVVNPNDAVVKVADYIRATSLISQTTLRSVVGQSDMDEILSQRERVNQRLQQVIDGAVGHQGSERRDPRRRGPRDDATCDGPPGGSRAGEARQDHLPGGRAPGSTAPR